MRGPFLLHRAPFGVRPFYEVGATTIADIPTHIAIALNELDEVIDAVCYAAGFHLDLQSTGGVAEHRAAVAAILRGSEVDTSDEGQVG